MSETSDNTVNITYKALSMMTRLFYKKYGDDTIPIIKDVWYKMGLASGERLKKQLTSYDFKSAANLFEQKRKQRGKTVTNTISDTHCHVTTPAGYICNVGLENAGRRICEAVMSVNQGQFKAICGFDVDMKITKSRAKGDDRCEFIISCKETPVE